MVWEGVLNRNHLPSRVLLLLVVAADSGAECVGTEEDLVEAEVGVSQIDQVEEASEVAEVIAEE